MARIGVGRRSVENGKDRCMEVGCQPMIGAQRWGVVSDNDRCTEEG